MPQVALALNLTTTKGYPTFREAVGWYGIKCIWFDTQSTKNQQLPSMYHVCIRVNKILLCHETKTKDIYIQIVL